MIVEWPAALPRHAVPEPRSTINSMLCAAHVALHTVELATRRL